MIDGAQNASQGSRAPLHVWCLNYEGSGTAYESQFLGLVQALEDYGVSHEADVFVSAREYAPARSNREPAAGVSVKIHLRPPLLGPPNLAIAWAQLAPRLARRVGHGQNVVLHCRGQLTTRLGLMLQASAGGRVRVVSDFRGVVAQELMALAARRQSMGLVARVRDGNPFLSRVPEWVLECEQAAYHRADVVTCVSSAFVAYLAEKYGVRTGETLVFPTCTRLRLAAEGDLLDRKEQAKAKLGLQGKLVVAFLGSFSAWSDTAMVDKAFSSIAHHTPAHLMLIASNGPDRGLLKKWGHCCTWVSLPHKDVQRHLMAADVGLLLRTPSVINRVACPIKVAEYLAAGVPVLASQGIGDLDEILIRHGVGLTIRDPSEAGDAFRHIRFDYSGARKLLSNHFSWPHNLRALAAILNRAWGDPSA